MKRFIVFIISFGLLYMVFQILSGWILTTLYTSDLTSTEINLRKEVEFGETSPFPLLVTLLIASFAYFISKKSFKRLQ